jgi:CheY-like chemotaxis protein
VPGDPRVLVAEPNALARDSLADVLADLGVRPVLAATAADAEQEAGAEPFALALVAPALPDGDGFELAGRLAACGPVAMMLHTTDPHGHIERCRRAGVAHLRKPLTRGEVRRALLRALDPTAAEEPGRGGHDRPTGLRVLVVDDDVFNRKVSAMKLERWGHAVRVAAGGHEALALLDRQAFDVLFTEVLMPDMDGFELTAEVRRREGGTGGRLHVVALTADTLTGTRDRCLAAGMDGHVSKPIRDDDLLAALRAVARTNPSETLGAASEDTDRFAPAAPGFDEAAALARVGGNRAVLVGLIEVMYQDCTAQMAELGAALRAGRRPPGADRGPHGQGDGWLLRRAGRDSSGAAAGTGR